MWIGVYSRTDTTWSSADSGETYTAAAGATAIAPDGVAFDDDAVWTFAVPDGTTVSYLTFVRLGAPDNSGFALSVNTFSFATPLFGLYDPARTLMTQFSIGNNACGLNSNQTNLYALSGSVGQVLRNSACIPCYSGSTSVSGSRPFPAGYRYISELRTYTYVDETGFFVSGPGGCLWRAVGWLANEHYEFIYDGSSTYGVGYGSFGFKPRSGVPGCAGVVNVANALVEAVPGFSVFELRLYAGDPPQLTPSGVFTPGDLPPPEDLPALESLPTADWWTRDYNGDPGAAMQPGAEGGLPSSPLSVPNGWIPKDIPDGNEVPVWEFAVPLSEFSPLPNQTYTVDFTFAEPIRPILKIIPLVVLFIMGAAAVWEELRRY